jgi:hypothetical protein
MAMLLTFKYVSIFLMLSDYVRVIYSVNVRKIILVLISFSRVRPTSNYFRPSPLTHSAVMHATS